MAQTMKISDEYFQKDLDLGAYPIFSLELNRRVKNKEACVIAVVGEAGSSKSYTAIQIAKNMDKRFSVDQIVFTYSEYCKELARDKPGVPIVFDEPSYAMGKREWYKQINQALVKTIESQRFLVRPLIIPIININLLDKTLRDYLVIFQVHITGRGKALVYRIRASQGQDKIYRYLVCRLSYPILDHSNCQTEKNLPKEERGKSTCLACSFSENCNTLRAQYERKKMTIQLARYEQDEEQARTRESKEFTDEQLITLLKPYANEYMKEDKVNASKLRSLLYAKQGIKIGHNRAYALKALLELQNQSESPS